jgi:transcriptional regulator with XRE-family HTH domain
MSFLRKSDQDPIPNKFTIAMGELIRKAREEAGLSQEALAKVVYRRRETISVIENGKSEVGTSLLALIAHATKKPLSFFYPQFIKVDIVEENLADDELELLMQFRRIWNEEKSKIAINQIKALADLDEEEFLEIKRKDMLENMDKDSPYYKKLVKKGIIKEDSE